MRVVQEQPPIIDQARRVFRLPKGAIFTYGNVLYNPSGNTLDIFLMKHEETHAKQQGKDPDGWWQKYLSDPKFRLSQEIEAYQNQYREAKKHIKDKNSLFRYLLRLAKVLSSPMYGSIVGQTEARRLISMK